ncbi:MAG: MBL fold metallo-hydrolase [Clostridiales Family XIII bacterium]|jgi:ribonuclease J|nr:MBL fold metallo-hydrolase [Clostridiales Family XIII bacterium]
MKLKIHRGAAQIGGNIVEIATKSTKIILDCGRNLPPLDDPKAADDMEIDGLTRGESAYAAVFVTHYHADHCGLAERVNADIPIYMSEDTKNVLDVIADFINRPLPRVNKILNPGHEERIGDIKVVPLNVYHSAMGAMAFLVEADGQKLLYTGDFNRIDETFYTLIDQVDILLCEGTNIGARNGMTEQDVELDAARIMRETDGPVFVLCSTTNIERVRRIERACNKSGRTMAIDPFMKAVTDKAASQLLLVNPVGFVPNFITEEKTPRIYKYLARDFMTFAGARAVSKMTNLTFMVRQSMGEFLERLNRLSALKGSTLIYSMWRGYENTAYTKKFLDLCRSLGMNIEYLHASGHAYREILETTVSRLNPKTLIPIHTESAETFCEMYDNVVTLCDGEVFDCERL